MLDLFMSKITLRPFEFSVDFVCVNRERALLSEMTRDEFLKFLHPYSSTCRSITARSFISEFNMSALILFLSRTLSVTELARYSGHSPFIS
jgi:hypothetical protein